MPPTEPCRIRKVSSSPGRASRAERVAPPANLAFYRVPLQCEAAPQIGCGCRAKPVLAALERNPEVGRVWLRRCGSVLAIEWLRRVNEAEASRIVCFALWDRVAPQVIKADERNRLLADFHTTDKWYRGAEVDRLSEEEAEVIAARLVRRIASKIDLPDERRAALECDFACACRAVLLNSLAASLAWRRQMLPQAIRAALYCRLDERAIATLEETLADDRYRPRAGEA